MALTKKLKPGCVLRIGANGMMEIAEMKFCEVCSTWYLDSDHLKKHMEPVEPDILVKET